MRQQQRRILLIIDNAPSHQIAGLVPQESSGFKTISMDHVLILLLPASTAAVMQPLSAGIIAAWKMSYRSRFIDWQLEKLDTAADAADLKPSMMQVRTAYRIQCKLHQS